MQLEATIPETQERSEQSVEIRIARSLCEVERLREPWTTWPTHRDSDIDFYLMIIQSNPDFFRPHVITLYRNGKPDAILVGRFEKKRLALKAGYLRLFRPWVRSLTFVLGAIHGNASPRNTQILLSAIMDCLKNGEADVALLEFVPLESPLYKLALQLPGILSRDTLPPAQGHELMIIPDSIDDVYRQMSHVRRKHLRANIRKLLAHPHGETKIVCYRSISELDRMFEDAETIACKTYQRGLGAGFADTPDVRRRLDLAVQKGWLRAYLLYLGDRPCVFWIGTLYENTFLSEYMGYDPEFRQFSPGMVLIMHVIESFCNRADGDVVKELDFGLGDAEYKEALCSRKWFEAAIYIFSPTLKGLSLKSMRTTTRLIDKCGRRVLASTKIFSRFKRAWRDRLAKRRH